jgi:hypothetical protein
MSKDEKRGEVGRGREREMREERSHANEKED